MSRAYRVRVQESARRVVHAEDHVSCQLELLEILPCEQLAQLLATELAKLGFEVQADTATRRNSRVTVQVDLPSATVTVQSAGSKEVEIKGQKVRMIDEDWTRRDAVERELQAKLQDELNQQATSHQLDLQKQITDQLEAALGDIRRELDGAVNRVTAEALKIRAAQLGQIKSISEDPDAGSLTIVVEV